MCTHRRMLKILYRYTSVLMITSVLPSFWYHTVQLPHMLMPPERGCCSSVAQQLNLKLGDVYKHAHTQVPVNA